MGLGPAQIGSEAGPPRVSAGFDGAQGKRRLAQWQPTGRTLNSILAGQSGPLLRRTRDLARNNTLAGSIQESFAANLVGTGVKPSSMVDNKPLRERINALWVRSTDETDADEIDDFYGQQLTVANELFEAGEVFGLLIERDASWDLAVPLQVRLIQAEQCPQDLSRPLPAGGYIRQGIEFDARHRRVAYWFYPTHPGEDALDARGFEPVRVRASDVVHVFERRHAGQVRGVSRLARSMVRLYDLDLFDSFELERKKLAAANAGWITQNPETADPAEQEDPDDPGASTIVWAGGTINRLAPGEEIKFTDPADVGGSYEAFKVHNKIDACAGTGMPYSSSTGDSRRANYGSQRAELLEMRRRLEPLIWSTIVRKFGRPVRERWFRLAVQVGAIALPGGSRDWRAYSTTKWIPQAWAWIDPEKDRKAEVLAVRAGFKARADVVEAEGYDVEDVDKRIKADREREEALGLEFPELKKKAVAQAKAPPAEQPRDSEPDDQAEKEAA